MRPVAIRIGEATNALDDATFDPPVGWHEAFVGDMGEFRDDVLARAQAMAKGMPVSMLVRAYGLGCAPPDTTVAPFKRVARTLNGRPAWFVKDVVQEEGLNGEMREREVEVDGWNYRGRRPRPGAYQKMRLVPDPGRDLASCLEHMALRDGMVRLHRDLRPVLGESLAPLSLPGGCPMPVPA